MKLDDFIDYDDKELIEQLSKLGLKQITAEEQQKRYRIWEEEFKHRRKKEEEEEEGE